MDIVVIIPARLKSTRLPNKLLLDLGGKSIIQRVFEQALKAEGISKVYIAVDHNKLLSHCTSFTSNVILTSEHHNSGTDRIAEAISKVECDAVINVQGDEPFIDPKLISKLALEVKRNAMVSAMCPIKLSSELEDPNNVKVVTDINLKAIYFSRSVIPYNRDGIDFDNLSYMKHLGIYGYTKEFLLRFSKIKATYLEETEKLEQLRVLENGFSIQMVLTSHNALGIDTLDDYNEAKKIVG